MEGTKQPIILKRIITGFVILSLVIALISSYFLRGNDLLPKVKESLPQAQYFVKVSTSPVVYEGYSDEDHQKKVGFVAIGEATGYGGPLTMVTGIDLQGKIVGIVIANHKDTPSFIQMLKNKGYLKQFISKPVTDSLSIENDIDRVSGATYSSRGVAMAVAQGAHSVAQRQLGLSVTQEPTPVKFGLKEMSILALILLAYVSVQFKISKLRWVTLIGGLIFLGFKFNAAISMSNIASLLMGYFPPVKQYVFWYLLLAGIPGLIFALRKNIYCYWLCPFGAAQEVAAKIGGGKFRCRKEIDLKLRKIKYVFAYLSLMLALIFQTPGFAGYEPFATLFGLKGFGVMWFILPIVLFSSLFIDRFWCKYFCPVGVVNELILKARRFIDKLFERAPKRAISEVSSVPESLWGLKAKKKH
ncbi:FMN-binding protein [Desulfosporosinus orientis DSM 765]|uniref:FMN-binding protein n=1 Tax=Desulfosporosinus orientis (strain ATCC 19365 / DSM 765 / NCIMB 8382 / VKM B-1628 / Singapore I) TaxID=768706 RepID=G7W9F6_DESOD|nr:4Fe-4S binding protein [Desulfosporosinus orientis]AET69293.1 FMN-binding protein [Desulfosporosinus orientis DSM 765]